MRTVAIFTMVMILVFFAIPVLYVWKVKHPSRPLWKWCACFVVIIHGPPIIAGYLTGYLMGFTTYGLGYIFHMNHETSAEVARVVLTVLAASTYILGVYTTTKIIQRPVDKEKKAQLLTGKLVTKLTRG